MTEQELDNCLDTFGSWGYVSVDDLVAEIRRLRALVLEKEWAGRDCDGDSCCAWCAEWSFMKRHAPDCPAFSAPGVLR